MESGQNTISPQNTNYKPVLRFTSRYWLIFFENLLWLRSEIVMRDQLKGRGEERSNLLSERSIKIYRGNTFDFTVRTQ
jgi:hypothetical protein